MFLLARMAMADVPLNTYDYAVVKQTNTPLLLVTIKSLPREQWTNGNPPRPLVKVEGFIRSADAPTSIQAVWKPLPPDFTWAGKDETKMLKQWQEQPLTPPPIKSKWYVAAEIFRDVLQVSPLMRYPASNDIYKAISPFSFENEKEKHAERRNLKEIEEEAARAWRLDGWHKSLQTSDAGKLASMADLVAMATITEMNHDERMVKFSIARQIKPAIQLQETIQLAGFPDALYSYLYDYTQTPEHAQTPLLIFMKQKIIRDESGLERHLFVPVNSREVILPAGDARLKALGIKPKAD